MPIDEHDVRNATCGIAYALKPYWKFMDDQTREVIKAHLRRIENACIKPERKTEQVCPYGR